MKKIVFIFAALLVSVASHAQFEQGKIYLGASMSGFDISSQSKEFHLGLDARGGFMVQDNLLALAEVGYNHWQHAADMFTVGAAGRYYIEQNGIFLGAGLKFRHGNDYNDVLPGAHVGYTFFLGGTVTIEPEVYFDLSTKDFDYTCYGLRVGIGIYLFQDHRKN
jgi:hypothetical protein